MLNLTASVPPKTGLLAYGVLRLFVTLPFKRAMQQPTLLVLDLQPMAMQSGALGYVLFHAPDLITHVHHLLKATNTEVESSFPKSAVNVESNPLRITGSLTMIVVWARRDQLEPMT